MDGAWTIDVHVIMRRTKRQQPTTFQSLSITVLFVSDACGAAMGDIFVSKQRHDLSERCALSRVFLAAAMAGGSLPHGNGLSTDWSIVSPIA
jgi:hypothetical protein